MQRVRTCPWSADPALEFRAARDSRRPPCEPGGKSRRRSGGSRDVILRNRACAIPPLLRSSPFRWATVGSAQMELPNRGGGRIAPSFFLCTGRSPRYSRPTVLSRSGRPGCSTRCSVSKKTRARRRLEPRERQIFRSPTPWAKKRSLATLLHRFPDCTSYDLPLPACDSKRNVPPALNVQVMWSLGSPPGCGTPTFASCSTNPR
jgi:hypothetical protein